MNFMTIREKLSEIELLPKAVLSCSARNKRTGEESGEKKISLSFSVTLWHLALIAAALFCSFQALGLLRAAARRSKTRQAVKAALKREREKMAGDEA